MSYLGRSWFKRTGLAGFLTGCSLAFALSGVSGCAGSTDEPEVLKANVKAGDMPAGGDWTGVYYSPTYGHLHLIKSGNTASGAWRTASGDKFGELNGEVNGDLLRYEWTERTIGMVGPSSESHGKGYFKYIVPPGDNVEHEIKGEWGLNDSDAGNPWEAIKQRNMIPDPKSVKPDETQQVNDVESWD